jgi:hypothetical protein
LQFFIRSIYIWQTSFARDKPWLHKSNTFTRIKIKHFPHVSQKSSFGFLTTISHKMWTDTWRCNALSFIFNRVYFLSDINWEFITYTKNLEKKQANNEKHKCIQTNLLQRKHPTRFYQLFPIKSFFMFLYFISQFIYYVYLEAAFVLFLTQLPSFLPPWLSQRCCFTQKLRRSDASDKQTCTWNSTWKSNWTIPIHFLTNINGLNICFIIMWCEYNVSLQFNIRLEFRM